MTTTVLNSARSARPPWQHAARAGVGAAIVNALLFAAAVAAGVFPALRLDPAAGPQMAIELVVLVSLMASATGVGVFGIVRRFAAEPLRSFTMVAAVVLVLSFVPPFVLPGTVVQALVLNVMHVVAAAFVVAEVRRAASGHAGGVSQGAAALVEAGGARRGG